MVKSGTLQEVQAVIIDSSLENREELLTIIQELKAILKETIASLS